MADKNQMTTIKVLTDIVLDASPDRPMDERQRAIDSLTLFRGDSMEALETIIEKSGSEVLKERADLYFQRLKSGADVNMNL